VNDHQVQGYQKLRYSIRPYITSDQWSCARRYYFHDVYGYWLPVKLFGFITIVKIIVHLCFAVYV